MFMKRAGISLIVLILLAISSVLISFAQNRKDTEDVKLFAHHTESGFDNPHAQRPKEFKDFWNWVRNRDGEARRTAPDLVKDVPVQAVDPEAIANPASAAQYTWIGHSTILLQINGINVLTDPVFSRRASPVPFAGPARLIPPAMKSDELPEIHYAVISHNHYDHLDLASVKALGDDVTWLVPLGLEAWFNSVGIANVIEMDWWEDYTNEQVTITCTPAQHFSGRTVWDTDKTLWSSWAIDIDGVKFWFGGDTGYNEYQFNEIGQRLGPFQLAAIPIGAYKPEWFMGPVHTGPQEALQIHRDIQSQRSFGIHWGTFVLADDLLTEAMTEVERLSAMDPSSWDGFDIIAVGETLELPATQEIEINLPEELLTENP